MTQHIGIVGCSAPGAALCYQTICTNGAEMGMEHSQPEVSMHTHPFSEYMRYVEVGGWDGVADLMLSSAEKLAGIGAQFLIAPCNTIHHAFEMVTPRSPLPWLHIAEEVAVEANRLGYRRVAVLGTKLLMEGPVYRAKFEQKGIEYRLPAEDERERIDRFIFEEMVQGRFTSEARSFFLDLADRLRIEGCDAIGMCCTELPILLNGEEAPLPLLDSTVTLARAALKRTMMRCTLGASRH